MVERNPMRKPWIGIVGLLALAALGGCAYFPPSARTRAEEVARLEAHVVPIIGELEVRFYLDGGSSCNAILYTPGEFCDGDESCGSLTEAYGPFDARIHSDFDRISTAIGASDVDTDRFDASFTTDGALKSVLFRRADSSWKWNWTYLYDPNDTVAKNLAPGAPTFTKINEGWWLVTEVDD